MWRDIVHEFMDEKIGVEYCRECYANREYPHRIYDGVVENDWIGLLVPEEYGGQGGDMIEQVILLEALGNGYDLGIPVAISSFHIRNPIEYGTEEQKQRFIPEVARRRGSVLNRRLRIRHRKRRRESADES